MNHKGTADISALLEELRGEAERRAADIQRLRELDPGIGAELDKLLKNEEEREIKATTNVEHARHLEERLRKSAQQRDALDELLRKYASVLSKTK